MGLFKKLFSSGQKEDNAPPSARRMPRLRLLPLHDVSFEMSGSPGRRRHAVTNLSVGGIGLMRVDGVEYPAPGEVIQGRLRIREEEHPVSIRVLYVSPGLVGCQFVEVPSEFREKVITHFSSEFAAAKMTAVKPEMLQEDPEGSPCFFVGEKGSELYYVHRDGKLVRFYLSFFGNYIEGNRETLRSGFVEEDEGWSHKPGYGGASFVKGDTGITAGLAETAIKFLSNIDKLDRDIRRTIVEKIEKA